MKSPSFQFYPGDWIRDNIAGCSLAAQGLWLRIMILAHDSERYGYLVMNGAPMPPEHIAARCGIPLDQYATLLAELDRAGVPSRTPDGTMFSRRMVRDEKRRKDNRKRQLNHYYSNNCPNADLTPTSHLYEDEEEREEGVKEGSGEPLGRLKIPERLKTEAFAKQWVAWVIHRKAYKKPKNWTQMFQEQLNWLEKYGPDTAAAILQASIRNGWQGLFEPKPGLVAPQVGKTLQSKMLDEIARKADKL